MSNKKTASKQAPKPMAEWLEQTTFEFLLDETLYTVSEESDRRIKAGLWTRAHAASRISDWAVAKLITSEQFNREHWKILSQITHAHSGTFIHFKMFFATALFPAVGGSKSWRTSEREQGDLLKRADAVASELMELLNESMDLDIHLEELGKVHSGLQPLIDQSKSLADANSRELDRLARARLSDPSLSPDQRMSMAMREGVEGYLPPRLSTYLLALRLRIAGVLPQPLAAIPGLEEILPEEQARIEQLFGIRKSASLTVAPKLLSGGDFGKYPRRKKALRTAVIHAIAQQICKPVYPAAPAGVTIHDFLSVDKPKVGAIEFSRADFIERLCVAWFNETPDVKEINALIRPYRTMFPDDWADEGYIPIKKKKQGSRRSRTGKVPRK